MQWKCINDFFGFCSGEPDGASKAQVEERATKVNGIDTIAKINMGTGATCSLDKKTCGKYMSSNQVYPEKITPMQAPPVAPPVVQEATIVDKVEVKPNTKEGRELLDIDARLRDTKAKDLNLRMFDDDQLAYKEEWKDMPEYIQEDLSAFRSIIIHFKNKEDIQAFAKLTNQTITPATKYLWYPKMQIEGMMDKRWKSES